jgi:lipopolysaccharide transport system permease protein
MVVTGLAARPPRAAARATELRIARDLARRDLAARHAGTRLGLVWLLLTPLSLLAVYSLVFGRILGLRWSDPAGGIAAGYVTPFFAGLIVHLFVADVVHSSLGLFRAKSSYVKKSPFPLWVLWWANLLRAGAHLGVQLLLLLALVAVTGLWRWTALPWLLPALGIGLAFTAALSLLLAALGPFFADLGEAARVVLRLAFYAAPVTYPLTLAPPHLQWLLWLNPLTHFVEPLRQAAVFGRGPEPLPFAAFAVATLLLALAARFVFTRVQGVVADVV